MSASPRSCNSPHLRLDFAEGLRKLSCVRDADVQHIADELLDAFLYESRMLKRTNSHKTKDPLSKARDPFQECSCSLPKRAERPWAVELK